MKYIFLFLPLLFLGCSTLVKTEIQEVYIPVRCNVKLPVKPKDDGSFESAKKLTIYYIEIEQIARDCSTLSNKE